MCASLQENLRLKENLKMKKIITIIILIISSTALSQELKEKKLILKLNTTQLIDIFSFPTFQLSAEKRINPYLSVSAEFGYQLYDTKVYVDTTFLKQKGFKANVEFRCYFQKLLNKKRISNKSELFLGLQLFHRENQKSNSVTYRQIENETNSIYFDDDFAVKKSVTGINLTLGSQISITKKIILEPYLLFGYMHKKLENIQLKYNEEIHVADQNDGIPIFVGLDIANKKENNVNFGFGLRIGYRL